MEVKRQLSAVAQTMGFGLKKVENAFLSQWGLTDTLFAAALFSLYPIVPTHNKSMSSATTAVAASSVVLPLVTARAVVDERGVGGRISR